MYLKFLQIVKTKNATSWQFFPLTKEKTDLFSLQQAKAQKSQWSGSMQMRCKMPLSHCNCLLC